jgi:error-prone DNA polymerase
LWQVRGLGEKPLPLFAAAGGGEAGHEPGVALRPMTAGREVVEDYRHLQLSLRAHPLSFLRPELERRGYLSCRQLDRVRPGRKVEVAGIILVRQKPGTAKVTFITIEDETGIANIIVWPQRFEAYRRTIMSAAMIGIKGTLQREGEVMHIIADRIEDHDDLLRSVGEMSFPHRHSPGDAATHGGSPDRGEELTAKGRSLPYRPADPEEVIRVKTRDFH